VTRDLGEKAASKNAAVSKITGVNVDVGVGFLSFMVHLLCRTAMGTRPEVNAQITLDAFHLDYRKMSSLRSCFFDFSVRNILLL
jgi:hypothetical protein